MNRGRALTNEEVEMWRRIVLQRPTMREKRLVFQLVPCLKDALPVEYEKATSYVVFSTVMDIISNRCDAHESGNRAEFVAAAIAYRQTSKRLREFVNIYIREYWISNLRSPFPSDYVYCNFITGEKIVRFLRNRMPTSALTPRIIKVGIPQKNLEDFRLDPDSYRNVTAGENVEGFGRTERPGTDADREALLTQVGSQMLGLSVEIFLKSAATTFQLRHSLPALIEKCKNLVSSELRWCQNVSTVGSPLLHYFFYEMPSLPKLKKLQLVAYHACPLEWFQFDKYFPQLEELEISYCLRRQSLDRRGVFPNLKKLTVTKIGDITSLVDKANLEGMLDLLHCPRLEQVTLDGFTLFVEQLVLHTTNAFFFQEEQVNQTTVTLSESSEDIGTMKLVIIRHGA